MTVSFASAAQGLNYKTRGGKDRGRKSGRVLSPLVQELLYYEGHRDK